MESITSFRFVSHKIRAFSEEGQGDDVQKKIKKRKRKELVGKKKLNLIFATLSLYFKKSAHESGRQAKIFFKQEGKNL